MKNSETFERVKDIGVVPAIRTSHEGDAIRAAAAILEGGIPIVEVSLACEKAMDVLETLVKKHSHTMLIGAGTVLDGEDVRQAALAGARFIVTSGFSSEAVAKAQEFSLPVFAGALTPTEVQVAHASGADAVKLFPCFAAGGPRYLRSLRSQYPEVEFIASGGVGLENCAEYIRAGACAIGVGGEIADSETMALGDFRVFTVRSKRLIEAIRKAREWMEESASLNVGEAR